MSTRTVFEPFEYFLVSAVCSKHLVRTARPELLSLQRMTSVDDSHCVAQTRGSFNRMDFTVN